MRKYTDDRTIECAFEFTYSAWTNTKTISDSERRGKWYYWFNCDLCYLFVCYSRSPCPVDNFFLPENVSPRHSFGHLGDSFFLDFRSSISYDCVKREKNYGIIKTVELLYKYCVSDRFCTMISSDFFIRSVPWSSGH